MIEEEEEEVEKRSSLALTLKGEDFILEQLDTGSFMFDLKLKRTVHGKNGVDREEFKIDGYGMPLNYAFGKIVNYRLARQYNGEVAMLKQFIADYRKAAKLVYHELKQLIKNR